MKKTALIYHSKHGSTEKYAKWIAEETGADLFKDGEVKASDLAGYERIIYGGAIHSGGIMYDICVIGGGASGLTAAITAAEAKPGLRIVVLEKKDKPGSKILASGNGRCNMVGAMSQSLPPSASSTGSDEMCTSGT